ncbi:MAG: tetratricopeptide repeat protein, partial [Planctomycetes bacterium]|nr:tetratricopeptide repeat protein [Planctomycetota bacterium]
MIRRWVLIQIIVFITLVGLKGTVIAAEGYEAAVNEGNVFVRKQMYQEALDAYERAIQLKPDASEVWYNKAVVLDYLGKYVEAVNSFEKATQSKPDYYE